MPKLIKTIKPALNLSYSKEFNFNIIPYPIMNQKNTSLIDRELLERAMSYEDYTLLIERLFAEGKTTGDNHSEAMLNYAKLNIQRMKRLGKTIVLSNELEESIKNYSGNAMTWLVLTEGWCGDAAQSLPLINKMGQLSDKIKVKLLLRDENLDIMDQFLTNGGRSIPKLIVLDDKNLEVCGTWGPRPKEAQEMAIAFRKKENGDYQEFNKTLQLWYAKDKTLSMQREFIDLITNCMSKQ